MTKNSTETFTAPEIQNKELVITDIAKMDFSVRAIYSLLAKTNIGMSWGINSPTTYFEKVLAFKVQGFLHKGWVYISLDYDDTFRITFTKRNRTTITKVQKGVYLEDLIGIIDFIVENNNDQEYAEKVKNLSIQL